MRMSKLLTTFLACICLVFQASFRIAEAAVIQYDGMITTGISFNFNTGKCCDSIDKSKCFTGAACCGSKQWTDGCFYSSNLCSTNECGTPAPFAPLPPFEKLSPFAPLPPFEKLPSLSKVPAAPAPEVPAAPAPEAPAAPAPEVPAVTESASASSSTQFAININYNSDTGKCCDSFDTTKCFTGSACCGTQPWSDGGCFYNSNLCSTNECNYGKIKLVEGSVTPAACKDIEVYYECAKAYTATGIAGSKMTFLPVFKPPLACGIGTGDVSGGTVKGSFPDGTTFDATLATTASGENVIRVTVPTFGQPGITTCSGNYVVESGNVLGLNSAGALSPSSSSAGVPAAVVPVVVSTSGGMMHFIHPVMVLGMGALLALLL